MTQPSIELFHPIFRGTGRAVFLRDGVQSTYVVPGDWVPSETAEEYVRTYGHADMLGEPSRVDANEVEVFVDGPDAYLAITDELEGLLEAPEADRAGFMVIHVGWTCHLDTRMGARGSYRDYMSLLAAAGIKTRTLYWEGSSMGDLAADQNALVAAAAFINGLRPAGVAKAIIDHQTRTIAGVRTASHHQKLWLILGPYRLTAFFGGVDVHTNRVNVSSSFKDPWHDVHACVRGPAAERFLGIALWRLMASIDWDVNLPGIGASVPIPVPPPEQTPAPSGMQTAAQTAHQNDIHGLYQTWNAAKSRVRRRFTTPEHRVHAPVRVHAGHTIGNPRIQAAGWTSEIHYMVSHAIEQARRFVYVEDQYFWHHEMATRLGRQVQQGRIKTLIVVTNVSTGLAEHPAHTKLGLWYLARAAGSAVNKIMVFERIGSHGRYVHSKIFVYDDVSAHVGSANFNNRGYAYDSESAGVLVDRVLTEHNWSSLESTLARKLRVKLWEKHLGIDTKYLYDALGSSVYWEEIATRTGSATAPVGPGTRAPTVQAVTIDGQRWSDWAQAHSAQEPPADVSLPGWSWEAITESTDSVIDPVP